MTDSSPLKDTIDYLVGEAYDIGHAHGLNACAPVKMRVNDGWRNIADKIYALVAKESEPAGAEHILPNAIAHVERAISLAETSPLACINELWRLSNYLSALQKTKTEIAGLANLRDTVKRMSVQAGDLQAALKAEKAKVQAQQDLVGAVKGLIKHLDSGNAKRAHAARMMLEALIRKENDDGNGE